MATQQEPPSGSGPPGALRAKGMPLPPSATDGPGGISRVSDKYHARALCDEILRPDRVYPIVGLSCHSGTVVPAMSPERARERVWPNVPIYIIEPRESRTLKELLPAKLDVFNGAVRIWFPGVDADSEPWWHPLIYEMSGVYGDEALDRLVAEFAHRRPESIEELSPTERAVVRLRSLPRPAAVEAGEQGSGLLVPLATRKDLRRLIVDLRRTERDYPIVVLTFGDTETATVFGTDAVRARLASYIPVYVLGTLDLCRRLPQAFSQQLAVDGGDARVFWPGVSPESDAAEHPLVAARSVNDHRDPTDRLIATVELSRPGVRVHVLELQERLERVERQAGENLRELRNTRSDRDAAAARAADAEAAWEAAERQLQALQAVGLDESALELVGAMDTDARLHWLIAREWLRALPTAADREEYPMKYVFGSGFIESVQGLVGTPLERTAWVCAMVASARAKGMPGIEPHHLRSDRGGASEQMVRSDGAKAWICKLGGDGASRLHYWVRQDGIAEFAMVTVHDAIGQRL